MELVRIILIILMIALHSSAAYSNEATQSFFNLLEAKQWGLAKKKAKDLNEKGLLKLALAQQFLDSSYKGNNFEEVIDFIYKNPHWAQINQLKTKAEEYITIHTNPKNIFDWFSNHPSHTRKAYKFYALACEKFLKDTKKLSTAVKNGWIYGEFTNSELEAYYKKFKHLLNKDDHVKRIDELLWQNKIEQAKLMFNLVDHHYQKSFNAQIAMINNKGDIKKIFANVPPEYYTQGLLYRYLSWRKKITIDKRSLSLFKLLHHNPLRNEALSKLQFYYAREFIEQRDFVASYKILQHNLSIANNDLSDREWLAGWIALRFLHEPKTALKHFVQFSKVVSRPMSASRGLYWIGRSYEALKDHNKAQQYYSQASHYPYTFYGQLALLALNHKKLVLKSSHVTNDSLKVKDNDLMRATELLIEYGNHNLSHIYAKASVSGAASADAVVSIAKKIKANYRICDMVEVAKTATHHHIFLKNYAFPTPYKITNSPIEQAFTYAIIRQESVFNPKAISSANAMGLMQLIKETACRTAKHVNSKCLVNKLTTDPYYNIKLGSNHLKQLLEEYKGSYILSIAAYNAGGGKVNRWINLHGDPRKMNNINKVIDWIELIPFGETRNYVHRVLENIQVYRTILNKENSLRIKDDLI